MEASGNLPTEMFSDAVPPLRLRVMGDGVALVAGCILSFTLLPHGLALATAAWWCLTIVTVRSDLDRFIIPNWASAGIAASSVLALAMTSVGLAALSQSLAEATLRAAALFLIFWGIGWAYRSFTSREGLGFGDVKLGGAIAFWLGPHALLVTLEVATFAALAIAGVKRLRHRSIGDLSSFNRDALVGEAIPFGAFLAPAAWFVYMSAPLGAAIWPWPKFFGA